MSKVNSQGGGIIFNTDLGQHILKNPLVVQSMIEKVSPSCSCGSNEDSNFSNFICSLN